jgi:hypothetical protein
MRQKAWMEERSWFWRKIGFWFVPIRAAELGPEQWAELLRFSRPTMTLRARRVLVLSWIVLLAVYARIAFFVARLDATAAIGPVLPATLLAWFAFSRMRIGLTRTSLQDRALITVSSLRISNRASASTSRKDISVKPSGHAATGTGLT